MRTDLHIHTTASDGCWTPQQVIDGILQLGIQLFAVTDHDSIDNVVLTETLSRGTGTYFVKGVEVSATFDKSLVHILGYGIDPTSPLLMQILLENRQRLEESNEQDIHSLIKLGYPLVYEDYAAYDYDRTRGGWKSLNFLIDQKLCNGPTDFFDTVFPKISKQMPVFLPVTDVVDVIHSAGGIPILAHPGVSLPADSMETQLALLQNLGIAGVECYAQYHDKHTTQNCVSWCQNHAMLITGGSDYHGGFVGRTLGVPVVDHEVDLNLAGIIPED